MKLLLIFLISFFLLINGDVMALNNGQKAPDAVLYGYDLKPVKISDFVGKTTVLAFVPGAFTGVCTKEICTFQDALANFNQLDAQVVAISVDAPFSNKAWADKNNISFPILSDYNRDAVKAYDVYHSDFAGLMGYTAAKRAVFVLDKDGNIAYSWVSDNPGVEPNYDEVKEAVKALN